MMSQGCIAETVEAGVGSASAELEAVGTAVVAVQGRR
jgi:hypothetical protein